MLRHSYHLQAKEKGVKVIDEDGLFSLIKAAPDPNAQTQQPAASAPRPASAGAAPAQAAAQKGKAAVKPLSGPSAASSSRAGLSPLSLLHTVPSTYRWHLCCQQQPRISVYIMLCLPPQQPCMPAWPVMPADACSSMQHWRCALQGAPCLMSYGDVCRTQLWAGWPLAAQGAQHWRAAVGAETQAPADERSHWQPRRNRHHQGLAGALVRRWLQHTASSNTVN